MQNFSFKGFKAPELVNKPKDEEEKEHIQISDEEYSEDEYEEI